MSFQYDLITLQLVVAFCKSSITCISFKRQEIFGNFSQFCFKFDFTLVWKVCSVSCVVRRSFLQTNSSESSKTFD